MVMLRIEPDYTTQEAGIWLTTLVWTVFTQLDFEACVGLVNGDAIEDALGSQLGRLSADTVDTLVDNAILQLL